MLLLRRRIQRKRNVAATLRLWGRNVFTLRRRNLPLTEQERQDDGVIFTKLRVFRSKEIPYTKGIFLTFFHRNTLLTALRELAAICHYGTLVDKMLCNRTVTGLRDHGHRERLLRDTTLTLQKAIDLSCKWWVTRLGSQTAFTYASENKKLDARLEACENTCSSQKYKY